MRLLFLAAYAAAGLSTAELLWMLTASERRTQPPVAYVMVVVAWPAMLLVDTFMILSGNPRAGSNQCGKTA